MSWRDVIEAPSHYSHNSQKGISEDIGNNGVKDEKCISGCQHSIAGTEKRNSNPNAHYSHNPQKEMPSRPELERICRRAVADYPSVDPERLRRFLEVSEDPMWCSERTARHIARRMSEGLIREGEL